MNESNNPYEDWGIPKGESTDLIDTQKNINNINEDNNINNNININSLNINATNTTNYNNNIKTINEVNEIKYSSKNRILAIFLYIFLSPFCIGDLYLGFNEKFKKQIKRYILIYIFSLISPYLPGLISLILFAVILVFTIENAFHLILNIISGIKLIIFKKSYDAYGYLLK